MPYLESIRVFTRTVELGSITAGGRDNRLTPAVASNRIKELEERLGVRLFNRTTRKLTPTEVGRAYYDTAKLDRVPNDGTWVIAYCACPHHASGEVVDALRRRGYPHTAVLDEGILYWRRTGLPLAGVAAAPPPEATPAKPPAP